MPEFVIRFAAESPDTIELPNHRYPAGRYRIDVDNVGGVDVFGDRDGLLYLAEVIVRCALGKHLAGFHVHLPKQGVASGPDTTGAPELTIYSAATDL